MERQLTQDTWKCDGDCSSIHLHKLYFPPKQYFQHQWHSDLQNPQHLSSGEHIMSFSCGIWLTMNREDRIFSVVPTGGAEPFFPIIHSKYYGCFLMGPSLPTRHRAAGNMAGCKYQTWLLGTGSWGKHNPTIHSPGCWRAGMLQ